MTELAAAPGNGHFIDLLVTDITMPEIDGLELARQARAQRPSLPVLYLTGYAQYLADKIQVVSRADPAETLATRTTLHASFAFMLDI